MEDLLKEFLNISCGGNVNSNLGLEDGSGEGSGYGYCYGDGTGFGYGCGSGNSGSDSSGFGYGTGYLSGNGSSDGEGYGYGDGSDIVSVNKQKVYMIDDTPTLIDSIHDNYAKGSILNTDLTLTPCYIAKVGDYFAHAITLRDAFKGATLKYEIFLPISERIARFNEQYPERDKPIPAIELFEWHHKLTGSCLLGRQQWCRDHNINLEGTYTVNEFINLTKDAYGGDIIKQLEETKI